MSAGKGRAVLSHDSVVLKSVAAPAILRRIEPSMLLWLVMIAVLIFLVASPTVRLLVSSLQETGHRTTYARQLS